MSEGRRGSLGPEDAGQAQEVSEGRRGSLGPEDAGQAQEVRTVIMHVRGVIIITPLTS